MFQTAECIELLVHQHVEQARGKEHTGHFMVAKHSGKYHLTLVCYHRSPGVHHSAAHPIFEGAGIETEVPHLKEYEVR